MVEGMKRHAGSEEESGAPQRRGESALVSRRRKVGGSASGREAGRQQMGMGRGSAGGGGAGEGL